MAKNIYTGVAGVARKGKQPYFGVGGVSRKVKAGYKGIGGVARQFFAGGTPIGNLAGGTSVYMNVNGARKEFIVVHQGRPSTLYDASCDGTWLLMKEGYTTAYWYDYREHDYEWSNDYSKSDVHSYLKDTFVGLLDSGVRSSVKSVKIPYYKGDGTVASGSSGLSTKIFLLSGYEVGLTTSVHPYIPVDGSCLSYFSGTYVQNDTRRVLYVNGTTYPWWLRSGSSNDVYSAWYVTTYGASNLDTTSGEYYYVRPAMIFPSTALVDDSYNIIA